MWSQNRRFEIFYLATLIGDVIPISITNSFSGDRSVPDISNTFTHFFDCILPFEEQHEDTMPFASDGIRHVVLKDVVVDQLIDVVLVGGRTFLKGLKALGVLPNQILTGGKESSC